MAAKKPLVFDSVTGVPQLLQAGDTLAGVGGGPLAPLVSSDTTIGDNVSNIFVQRLELSGSVALTLAGSSRLMGLG